MTVILQLSIVKTTMHLTAAFVKITSEELMAHVKVRSLNSDYRHNGNGSLPALLF